MQFTSLAFAAILAILFISGGYYFWSGMVISYPELSVAEPYIGNTTAIANQLNTTIGTAQTDAQTNVSENDAIGALMGYFRGAYNAFVTLLMLPITFLSMIAILAGSLGMFNPGSFLMQPISMAVGMITVIGILYYLTKVK